MRDNTKAAAGRRGTRANRPPRYVRVAKWLAVPVGMLVSSLLVWQASNAAFSDTTENPTDNWASGTVVISDDDSNGAMFDVSNLKPGDTGSKCIAVEYDGTLAASVKLYASAPSGTLAQYLNLKVEHGTGGTFADCTGFSADASPVFNGTLAGFATAHANFGNGWGSFAPTAPDQTKTYKFTYTLQDNNDAQGKSAGTTFTWEAQNTTS